MSLKTSQLPVAAVLDGTETIAILQAGQNKRTTAAALIPAGTPVFVATPESDTDFSMFAGDATPVTGYFLAMEPTRLWVFKAGWSKWRHSTLQLSN